MNKVLLILFLVFLASCSPKEVTSDQLVERQGISYEVDSIKGFNGISVDYFTDTTITEKFGEGLLWKRTTYKNGVMDGLFEIFYTNGQVKWAYNHKDGKEDGLYKLYNKDGRLWVRGNHKGGGKVGLEETYWNTIEGLTALADMKCYYKGEEVESFEFFPLEQSPLQYHQTSCTKLLSSVEKGGFNSSKEYQAANQKGYSTKAAYDIHLDEVLEKEKAVAKAGGFIDLAEYRAAKSAGLNPLNKKRYDQFLRYRVRTQTHTPIQEGRKTRRN